MLLSAIQVDVNTTAEQISAQLTTLTEKYLANNEYILSGTGNGYVGAEIAAMAPWANLGDRYYPTVATLPQSGSGILTKAELGGYFTPNNVGASVYLTKNITSHIDTKSITPGQTYTYIDPSKFNKGRGNTGTDQNNIITHYENTNWQKAVGTGTAFDGQVLGSDLYQKFIPYQSSYETTKNDSNGVVSIQNDFEFWTGADKDKWLVTNKYTQEDWVKYHDIDLRVRNLLVTPNTELCAWQTDVYGNQYALYKAVPAAGRTMYNMQNAFGQLWTKTVDGTISPAVSSLSAIFYKHVNEPAIYSQLSANNIKNIEVFFDTLIIELSGYTIYEKISYDYTNNIINCGNVNYLTLDYHTQVSTRLLSSLSLTGITVGSVADVYYGGNWYNEALKKFTACLLLSAHVISSVGELSGYSTQGLIVPVLYQYDINKPGTRERIFPTNSTDYSEFLYAQGASAIDAELEYLTYIEPPVITYNKDASSYVISFIAFGGMFGPQAFNIISYTTNQNILGKVLTNQSANPILTDNNLTILTV